MVASLGRFGETIDLFALFQSPSLRGSGRFALGAAHAALLNDSSQSPSLRGSGRFKAGGKEDRMEMELVSIPFIAGQWSLRSGSGGVDPAPRPPSQSPSLRGSGRFSCLGLPARLDLTVSIPFIAGQWSLREEETWLLAPQASVSIPFIAGQWSLPIGGGKFFVHAFLSQSPSLRGSGRFGGRGREDVTMSESLNPLHCGAVVASPMHQT